MSGIYGRFQSRQAQFDLNSVSHYMKRWNIAYGNEQEDSIVLQSLSIGICADHITNASGINTSILRFQDNTAVMDVILYNRDELINKYHLSSSYSDEELLFRCILSQGLGVLAEVNGDFCGAIYSESDNRLTLFRDHMGIRPLFYYHTNDWIGFSSDIRGLIALPDVPADVNPDWLYKNICGYDTTDYTATEIKGIYILKPASSLVISMNEQGLSFDEHVYWQLGAHKIRLHSEQAYCERLRDLITDSIQRRLSVFPDLIGAELSGGLDSGVIDILINRLHRDAVYYSWSFSPDTLPLVPDDERQVIADICEQEGITCEYGETTIDMGPNSNIGKSHIQAGLSIDLSVDPFLNLALPLYINTEIISETAQLVQKHGAKTVFSGHGGDEGVSHRCDPFEMFYHKEYIHFAKYLWKQNKGQKRRLIKTLKQYRYRASRSQYYQTNPFQTNKQAPDILRRDFASTYANCHMPVLTFAFDAIKYIYSGNTAVRPLVAALLGAYSGARYIFPYLDYRVIDYAVSIPRHLYLKGNQNRYIFRQAFKDLMPESLYTCTAKNNPSTANMDENRDTTGWFERLQPYKEHLYSSLDRSMWEKYLDFEILDKWYHSPDPGDEEHEHYLNIINKLKDCYQYQNMVEKVKAISQANS